MDASDPFSTPARRRRLIHDIAKGYVFPLVIDAKQHVAEVLVRNWAAVLLQKHVRAFVANARVGRLRSQRRAQAATRIQAHMRRYLAQIEVQLLRTAYRRRLRILSATRLQMAWRWRVTVKRVAAREAISRRIRAATTIQCCVQMRIAKRRFRAIQTRHKQLTAVVRIQHEWRAAVRRRREAHFHQVQQASSRIGHVVLAVILRRRQQRDKAATTIQCAIRRTLARMRYAVALNAFLTELLQNLVVAPVLETVLQSARMKIALEEQRQAEERLREEAERTAMAEEERLQREYELWQAQPPNIEPPSPPPLVFTPQASPINEIKSPMSYASSPKSESTTADELAAREAAEQALLRQLQEESRLLVMEQRRADAATIIKTFILQWLIHKQRNAAAVKLQTNWRRRLAKRELQKRRHAKRTAASICLQRNLRGLLARRRFSRFVQHEIAQNFQDIYMLAQSEIPKMLPTLNREYPSEAQFEVTPLWAKLYSILPLPAAPPGCVPRHLPNVPDNFVISRDEPAVPDCLRALRSKDITNQFLLEQLTSDPDHK